LLLGGKKLKKSINIVIFVLIVILMSNTLILSADNSTNRNLNIINVSGTEPEGLDPQQITSEAAMNITNSLMEGLMRRSGKNIIPGMASRYEVSKDGLTYTFYLRDAVWTDGKPVTANDFAYGWQRALDPNTACDYAFIMYYIKNGEKYNMGKADKSQLGIKVINAKTLQVTLENPTPYFVDLTANVTYMPARQDILEKYKDKYFSGPQYIVSNGPFKLAEWEHEEYIAVVKNPSYWNSSKVKLDGIDTHFYSESFVESYLNGNLDAIGLFTNNTSDIPKSEINSYFTGTVFYLQFNNSDKSKILSNVNIRKALTLSINRQEFLKQSNSIQSSPAFALVAPEIIPGKSKSFREEAGNLIKDNDLKAAKEALNLGLKQLKLKKLPAIKFTVDNTDLAVAKADALAAMWKKNLGIDIQVEPMEFKERLEAMYDGSYQIQLAGWGPDYNDALTYLEMFDSSVKPNSFGYQNADFNNLIKSIKKEINKSTRIDLLKKAEKKILDEYVVAPLYFRYDTVAIKPYVKNLALNAMGSRFDFTFTELIEGAKTLKTSDSKFSMKTNAYWFEDSDDVLGIRNAELVMIDSIEEAAGAVISTSVDSKLVDLEYVYNLLVSELQNTFPKSDFADKVNTKVSGFPAIKFRFNAEEDGIKTSFSYVIISAPGKVYQVMLWSETETYEQRKSEFDKMIQSINITK
jgi:oligopeptide transport system substrate-binding protein